jgi:hypothetical protein
VPVVEGIAADYHKYVIDGLIDAEVVERQSRKQEQDGKTIVVHHHKQTEVCGARRHQVYGDVKGSKKLRTEVNNRA